MKTITGYAKGHRKKPTKAELELKKNFQRWKINFRTQRPFGYYIVDFLFPKRRLVLELDGSFHDNRKGYDEKRTRYLESQGLTVLRFPNEMVFTNPLSIKEKVLNYPELDVSHLHTREIYGRAKY